MNFYRIRHDINSKVIGSKYPQVEEISIPTTWDDPLFIQSFVGKQAPQNVLLPEGVLYKSSKLTDLVSASAVGLSLNLLISEKLQEVLQDSKSMGVQFFQTQLHERNGLSHAYAIVHPFAFGYKLLDFKNSEIGFYRDNVGLEFLQSIPAKDIGDLEKTINEYEHYVLNSNSIEKYLLIKKPKLREDINIDFFALQYVYGGTGFFVSENLKMQIQAIDCTGIVFTEPDKRYP
jgi:hypothetical protein